MDFLCAAQFIINLAWSSSEAAIGGKGEARLRANEAKNMGCAHTAHGHLTPPKLPSIKSEILVHEMAG